MDVKMCWSARVSLASFVVGTALHTFASLLVRRAAFAGLCAFGQYTLFIQMAEYFIWADQGCGQVNYLATRAAVVLNLTQPFVAYVTLAQGGGVWSRAAILLYAFYTYWMLSRGSWHRCTTPRRGCAHLDLSWWGTDLDGVVFLVTLMRCVASIRPRGFMLAMQAYMAGVGSWPSVPFMPWEPGDSAPSGK